jgi:predicted cupin superfamily sugar epimerase
MDVSAIKNLLQLEPLTGEGGWFCQTYSSVETLPGGSKPLSTAIYYLLTDEADSFSAMHRLPGDEVYHFYLGDPLEMLLLYPDGGSEVLTLGQDLAAGQMLQLVVPGGVWQGSRVRPGGKFSLLGTTMAPGFVPADYQAGERDLLCRQYPDQRELIQLLTRTEEAR